MTYTDHLAQKVVNLSHRAAFQFNLSLNNVYAFPLIYRDGTATRDYGYCDLNSRNLYIRLHCLKPSTKPLQVKTIRDTMAHELAHLIDQSHASYHHALKTAIDYWLLANWDRTLY